MLKTARRMSNLRRLSPIEHWKFFSAAIWRNLPRFTAMAKGTTATN